MLFRPALMFLDSTEHPRLRHVQAVAPVMVGLHFTSVRRKKDPNANGPAILCSQLATPVSVKRKLGSSLSDTPGGGWSLSCSKSIWTRHWDQALDVFRSCLQSRRHAWPQMLSMWTQINPRRRKWSLKRVTENDTLSEPSATTFLQAFPSVCS